MRKLLFVSMFISLCILLSLTGCTGEGFQVEIEPSAPMATLSPTPVASLPSATETVLATATVTAEPEPVSTPTLEPSATATPILPTPTLTMPALLQPNTATTPVVCRQFKSYINIQQETNNASWRLMDYVFKHEDVITFLMWSDRPYPESSPTPVITPISEGGGPPYPLGELSQSRRILLKGQTWDFNSGTLVESPVTEQDAMQSPCEQDCPLEVIGVAPDNSWQLLQITEVPEEYQGLWLVNEETVTNVVPYVPIYSHWQWSNDSQMLWLIYTLQDINGETYGSESMVVDLTAPAAPQVVFQSWDETGYQWQSPPNLLSPDEYNLVFSPVDKTVLLYKRIGSSTRIPPDNRLDVYVIDVTQNPPQLLDTYEARYPFLIDWSDTLQDFLILELNPTGAVIYTLSSDIVYEIPMEILKQMPSVLGMDGQFRTDFSAEVDVIALNINLSSGGVAISPALEHVVFVTWNRAWAFSCSD